MCVCIVQSPEEEANEKRANKVAILLEDRYGKEPWFRKVTMAGSWEARVMVYVAKWDDVWKLPHDETHGLYLNGVKISVCVQEYYDAISLRA